MAKNIINHSNQKYWIPVLSILFILISTVIYFGFIRNLNKSMPSSNSETSVIYTTFYPLEFITKQITGNTFEVVNITPLGTEPHDFEPSAKTLIRLNSAKAFVFLGKEIDPWAEKKSENLKQLGVLTVAVKDKINLEKIQETDQQIQDPHFWLNPKLVSQFSQKLSNELSQKFPEKSEVFKSNLLKFQDRLNTLDIQTSLALSSCKQRKIIVAHDAYSYFAKEYNLEVVPISGLSPEEEPSVQKIAEIIDIVKANKINYIFLENTANPKITEVISSATGAKSLELNPIESLTEEQIKNGQDYFTVHQNNTKNIKIALNCV